MDAGIDFKQVIGIIENSKEFKDFIKKEPHYYLVHVFTTVDSENNSNSVDDLWQTGYYSKDTDMIVVFEDHDDMIFIHPPAEALKRDEYIQKLDLEQLKVSREDADDICKKILKEYYPAELSSKAICLLQNLPEFGQVWNITIVTLALNVINIKIDAIDGKVLKHSKENLMNWKS
jgi:hypothetical protein